MGNGIAIVTMHSAFGGATYYPKFASGDGDVALVGAQKILR